MRRVTGFVLALALGLGPFTVDAATTADDLIAALRAALPEAARVDFDSAEMVGDRAVIDDLRIAHSGVLLTVDDASFVDVVLGPAGSLEHLGRMELADVALDITPGGRLSVRRMSADELGVVALTALLTKPFEPEAVAALDVESLSASGVALGFDDGFVTADRIDLSAVVAGRVGELALDRVLATLSEGQRLTVDSARSTNLALDLLARGADGVDRRALYRSLLDAGPATFTLDRLVFTEGGDALTVEKVAQRTFRDEEGRIATEVDVGPLDVPSGLMQRAQGGTGGFGLPAEDLSLMLHSEGSYDIDTQASDFTTDIDADGYGHLALEVQGRALESLDFMTISPEETEQPTLEQLVLTYRDEGLVQGLIDRMAGAMDMERPAFAAQMMAFARLPLAAGMTTRLSTALGELEQFLIRPGTLTIRIDPEAPVPLEEITVMGLGDPGALGDRLRLQVEAVPPD